MMPIVDGLAEQYSDALHIQRLDATEPDNAKLMQQFGINGHPAFVLLDSSGQTVQILRGPQTEAALDEAIQQALR